VPVQNPPVQGVELGYAEITTAITNISSTSYIDAAGLAVSGLTIPPDRPVLVEFYASGLVHGTAGASVSVRLTSADGLTVYGEQIAVNAAAFAAPPGAVQKRFAAGTCPTAFKLQVKVSVTGGKITGTAPEPPSFLRVTAY
jgi:hypothetical protein